MRSLTEVLNEAAEFLRNGTAIHPGSDLANDLLALVDNAPRSRRRRAMTAPAVYPPNWPRCECGDFTLDGHETCGRAECGTQADAELCRHGEQDRRCPDCQNWLDRYGRCLQCAEPASEL